MRELTIHIGLHKTGTSYLQKAVFPRLKGVSVLRGIAPIRDLVSETGARILVTDEAISGIPFKGQWMQRFNANCEQLQQLFGDPAIIVGFREHKAMLLSLYKQYLHQGNTGDIDEFFSADGDDQMLNSRDLYYRPRLEQLRSRFSRVFVYTQERLEQDPAVVVGEMCQFMGSESPALNASVQNRRINVGLRGDLQMRWLRRANRLSQAMKATGVLPGLDNGVTRALGLTPRDFFQLYLAWVPSKQLALPSALAERLSKDFEKDWDYVVANQGVGESGRR